MGLAQREGDPEDVLSLEEVAEILGRPDWPRRNLMRVIREHGIDTFRPGRSEMLKRKALPMLEDAMTVLPIARHPLEESPSDMSTPPLPLLEEGLVQRGGVWHVDAIFEIEGERIRLRKTTGRRDLAEARVVKARLVDELRTNLILARYQRENGIVSAARRTK
jgi:hypothetical protein